MRMRNFRIHPLLMMVVLAWLAPSTEAQAPTGFAKPGSAIAVIDLFNLTDDAQYDPWERLLGRGLRRGLHTAKTEKGIAIEVVPQPRLLKAIEDLRIDPHYIPPEQAKPIGERVQSDLVVLGSFNIVEGVVAASLKIVDNHSGLLLHEETRFGNEDKIAEFVVDLSETLNGLLLAGLEGTAAPPSAPPPVVAAPPSSAPAPAPAPAQSTAPSPAAEPSGEGILEPVEESVAEPSQAPSAPAPRTQIAGPGGGAPPAPVDDLPMNIPVDSSQPAPPPPSAPPAPNRNVQDLLNQTWQNTQGTTSQPQAPAQPPSTSPVVPPYVGEPLPPQAPAAAPGFAPPSALPPRAPVAVNDPIESLIPPLPPQQQPPPDAVRSPFQPMTPSSAPPPPPAPDQLGYPMVPPNAPNYPPGFPPQQFQQPPPQPGPVGRFFNWVGRGFGLAEDPATPPQMQPGVPQQGQIPQQVGPPVPQQIPQQPQQQQERRPFLWIFDRDR